MSWIVVAPRHKLSPTESIPRRYLVKIADASRMPPMQQLVPYLTAFFYVVGPVAIAVMACVDIYRYVAAAVEMRSIFHTRVRMTFLLGFLFVMPGIALRQFDVPKSVAIGLNTVSVLALLAILVRAVGMIIALFSRPSNPRDDA